MPKIRRPSLVALAVSVALHLLLGWSLGTRWSLLPVASADAPAPPSAPELRFELVETAESAEREEPAPDSRFVSDRSTRAQDPFEDDAAEADERPRIPTEGRGRDPRPIAAAPEAGMPSPPTVAAPPSPRPSPPVPPLEETEEREETRREREVPRDEPEDRPRRETETAVLPPPEEREEPEAPEPAEQAERATPTEPRRPAPPAAEPAPPATSLLPSETPRPGRATLSTAERDELARTAETGEFSYEATQHFFAEYFLNLSRRVETTWNLLLLSEHRSRQPSHTVIEFKVNARGEVYDLVIGPSRGDELFPLLSARSIRRAGPFGPVPYDRIPGLPDELRGLPLQIRITFNLGD